MFPSLVLASWIPLSALAFLTLRPARAAVVVLLGGMLFLPEHVTFDAPLVPPMGKHEVSALCATLGLLVFSRGRLRAARLGRGSDIMMLLVIPVLLVTVLTNRQPLSFGPLVVPGLSIRDLVAILIRATVSFVMPYLAGRLAIGSRRDLRMLTRTILFFGMVYAGLMLFEIRFSPNLHYWIYGYHARGDFTQVVRWGGYRPTVFMEHGLAVALFALIVALQAATDGRISRWRFSLPAAWSTGFFVLMLVLCKSTGAIFYGLLVLPLALWAKPRRQLRFAVLLAVIVVAYPCVRVAGLFPDETITDLTRVHLSVDRAQSIEVRFRNERMLIQHVQERLWFGWGPFGRNRVYDAEGGDTLITDGWWTIVLGVGGLAYLFCVFGTMVLPVFRARRLLPKIRAQDDRIQLGGFALLQICLVFDLLPNGMFTPLPFFFAGVLHRMNIEFAQPEAVAAQQPMVISPVVLPPA